jgi:hypothetical protein
MVHTEKDGMTDSLLFIDDPSYEVKLPLASSGSTPSHSAASDEWTNATNEGVLCVLK